MSVVQHELEEAIKKKNIAPILKKFSDSELQTVYDLLFTNGNSPYNKFIYKKRNFTERQWKEYQIHKYHTDCNRAINNPTKLNRILQWTSTAFSLAMIMTHAKTKKSLAYHISEHLKTSKIMSNQSAEATYEGLLPSFFFLFFYHCFLILPAILVLEETRS